MNRKESHAGTLGARNTSWIGHRSISRHHRESIYSFRFAWYVYWEVEEHQRPWTNARWIYKTGTLNTEHRVLLKALHVNLAFLHDLSCGSYVTAMIQHSVHTVMDQRHALPPHCCITLLWKGNEKRLTDLTYR